MLLGNGPPAALDLRLVAVLGALFWITPAAAQTVVDADTLNIGHQLVHLYGIDVPDKLQSCDDGAWFPRPHATAALVKFIGDRKVECFQVYTDQKTGRPVSLCYAGSDDLQAFMVGQGWAWVIRPDTLKYIDYERQAMALRRGIHAHQCERADRWRRRQK
jgi:endonuclease YncB( thermonuclease family)